MRQGKEKRKQGKDDGFKVHYVTLCLWIICFFARLPAISRDGFPIVREFHPLVEGLGRFLPNLHWVILPKTRRDSSQIFHGADFLIETGHL
jgi:hypothetical protein